MSEMTEAAEREVLAALEPEQFVGAKKRPLPRRALKPTEVLTLWVLRVYLVAVMGILIYQVVTGGH